MIDLTLFHFMNFNYKLLYFNDLFCMLICNLQRGLLKLAITMNLIKVKREIKFCFFLKLGTNVVCK